jgi:sarcosine oxidase subunit alpha
MLVSNPVRANRLDQNLSRGKRLEFFFNGEPVQAYEGETIATALLAAGHWVFQITGKKKSPRGVYCNIGVCHSCLVVVDGEKNVRACQTPVSAGCRVERQES